MSNLYYECALTAELSGCAFKIMGAAELTTFKGGGDGFVFLPQNEVEFAEVYRSLSTLGRNPFILGSGSDVIMADGFCGTPIICVKKLKTLKYEDGNVYAQCGARIADVAAAFRKHGAGGFEFLCGVPATVGGAVRMNAGAFSSQTADHLLELRVLTYDCNTNDCQIKTLSKEDVGFSYRSGFDGVVLGARFKPNGMTAEESTRVAKQYTSYRARRQPKLPSCGSVFKNSSAYAGKLIEDCGLKGARCGGAQISDIHANFIVNTGGATAANFMELVRLCEREAADKFGAQLEREFVYLS